LWLAGASIRQLFAAGFAPDLPMVVALMVMIATSARR
jgi:TRAP-type C4-dicarboxylate transport system permease large subunit